MKLTITLEKLQYLSPSVPLSFLTCGALWKIVNCHYTPKIYNKQFKILSIVNVGELPVTLVVVNQQSQRSGSPGTGF